MQEEANCTVVVQRKNPKSEEVLQPPDYDDPTKSFAEQVRAQVEYQRATGQTARKANFVMRSLMVFQAPSQIYVFIWYIVPALFEDYDPWVRYFLSVLCWFVLVNGLANWFCVILFDPSYQSTRDNPDFIAKMTDKMPEHWSPKIEEAVEHNGNAVYNIPEVEGLPWDYCDKCEIHIPPRTYHCKYCKKCILKKDHHCFLVGNCIGFNNQRYFIVFLFYTIMAALIGGIFNFRYLSTVYWAHEAETWTDLLPFVAIFRCVFGKTKLHNCLMVIHIYLQFLFGFIGFGYFAGSMKVAIEGKTLVELSRDIPLRNTNSYKRNLKSVFGDFWFLNFYFPMTVVLRQKDDGIHWDGIKLEHNANHEGKKGHGNDLKQK